MSAFYASLTRALSGKNKNDNEISRIVHFGDSHIAADLMTGWLRRSLSSDFGDAGPGYLVPGQPASLRPGVRTGLSQGWHVDGLKQAEVPSDGRFGLAGICLTAESPDQRAWVEAPCDDFVCCLLRQPGGGQAQIVLDGNRARDVTLASAEVEAIDVPLAVGNDSAGTIHTIEIKTLDSGRVRLLGIIAERQRPGVVYDALGVNGARAGRLLGCDWDLFSKALHRRCPNLIVVSYGSNEAGDPDFDASQYEGLFFKLLARLKEAAPQASLLVISPPDRDQKTGNEWQGIRVMSALVNSQRQAATRAGAAFCDLYSAMGGRGTINEWAMRPDPLARPDRVHLTKAGYHLVADALHRAIVTDYLQSVWGSFRSLLNGSMACASPDWIPYSINLKHRELKCTIPAVLTSLS